MALLRNTLKKTSFPGYKIQTLCGTGVVTIAIEHKENKSAEEEESTLELQHQTRRSAWSWRQDQPLSKERNTIFLISQLKFH